MHHPAPLTPIPPTKRHSSLRRVDVHTRPKPPPSPPSPAPSSPRRPRVRTSLVAASIGTSAAVRPKRIWRASTPARCSRLWSAALSARRRAWPPTLRRRCRAAAVRSFRQRATSSRCTGENPVVRDDCPHRGVFGRRTVPLRCDANVNVTIGALRCWFDVAAQARA